IVPYAASEVRGEAIGQKGGRSRAALARRIGHSGVGRIAFGVTAAVAIRSGLAAGGRGRGDAGSGDHVASVGPCGTESGAQPFDAERLHGVDGVVFRIADYPAAAASRHAANPVARGDDAMGGQYPGFRIVVLEAGCRWSACSRYAGSSYGG